MGFFYYFITGIIVQRIAALSNCGHGALKYLLSVVNRYPVIHCINNYYVISWVEEKNGKMSPAFLCFVINVSILQHIP